MSDGPYPARWWAPRADGEATPDYLERVLKGLGADLLAARARKLFYDDFRAPSGVGDGFDGREMHRLVSDLEAWASRVNLARRALVTPIIDAVKVGEFDCTRAESDAWLRSPEGIATLTEVGATIRQQQATDDDDGPVPA